MTPSTFSLMVAVLFWLLYWRSPSNWLLLISALSFTVMWTALTLRGHRMTITDKDVREQVAAAVGANGAELTEGIDVDGIVEEIKREHGLINVDEINHDEFWAMVQRHDSTQQ